MNFFLIQTHYLVVEFKEMFNIPKDIFKKYKPPPMLVNKQKKKVEKKQ